MTFWDHSTGLGRLDVFEVYEFYDQPVLLSLQSTTGALYLAVLAETADSYDGWLCVATSMRRLQAVRSGGVDLRTAFTKPEDDRAFLFHAPHDDKPPEFRSVSPAEIPSGWLPGANASLALPTSTLPLIIDDLKTEAVQSRRDMFAIKLEPNTTTRNEVPARLAGGVLQAVQDTITALAQACYAELMFVRVGGGSFEMLLASADQVGLLNESAITLASQAFGQLVQLADNDAAFRQRVSLLKPDVAEKYLTFLRAIEDRVSETTVEWASPNPEEPIGRAVIQNETVKTAITAMVDLHETRRIEVDGTLVSTHTEKNSFEFKPDSPQPGAKNYTGAATAEVLDPSAGHTAGLRFRATIEEVRQQKPNGEVAFKHTLVGLAPL